MEMQQLRYFVAVVKHGHIGRAAEELAISQPALSRSIQALERDLGVPLLERTPHGVHPTMFGAAIVGRARRVLVEGRHLRATIADMRALRGGIVTIGMTPNFVDYVFPEALLALLARAEGLRVTVVTGLFEELVEKLRMVEIDVMFALLPLWVAERDLTIERIGKLAYAVYVRQEHPLARAGSLGLAEIAGHDWCNLHQPSVDSMLQRYFKENGIELPRQVVRATSVSLLKSLMLERDLVGVLPHHLARPDEDAGRLVALQVPELPMFGDAALVTLADRAMPPACEAFAVELRDRFRPLGERAVRPAISPPDDGK